VFDIDGGESTAWIEVSNPHGYGTTTIEREPEELEENVNEAANTALGEMDEYVAGKAASSVNYLNIRTPDIDNAAGVFNHETGELAIDPIYGATDAIDDGNTVEHEFAHAVEHSYNTASSIEDTRDLDGDELEFERSHWDHEHPDDTIIDSDKSRAFNSGLEGLGEDLNENINTERENESMEEELSNYQLKNSSEIIAVGYENYIEDFTLVTDKQPGLVDFLDENVTGGGWEETTIEEVRTSGGFESEAENRRHIPGSKSEEDMGEVVKVKTKDDDDDKVAHAIDSNEDELTVSIIGLSKTYDESEIESIESRQW